MLFFAKVHVQIFIFECGLISFGFGRHTGVMNDNLFQAFLKSACIIVLSKELKKKFKIKDWANKTYRNMVVSTHISIK